jgi:hypothetical protein
MNTTPTVWATQTGNSWGTSTAGAEIYMAATSKWSEQDWEEFETASGDNKAQVLHYLSGKYGETVSTLTV